MTSGDANGENKKFALLYDKLDDDFVLRHRDISKVSIEQTFIANADGVNDPIPLELYVDYVDKENRLIVLKSSTLTLDTNPQSNNYETIGSEAVVTVSNKQALVFPQMAQGYASISLSLHDGFFETDKISLSETVPQLSLTLEQKAITGTDLGIGEIYPKPGVDFYLPIASNNNAPIEIRTNSEKLVQEGEGFSLKNELSPGASLNMTLNTTVSQATTPKTLDITTEGKNTLTIVATKKGFLKTTATYPLHFYREIYVDGTHSGETLGTRDKPYKSLDSAIDLANKMPSISENTPLKILIKGNCSLDYAQTLHLNKRNISIEKASSVSGDVAITLKNNLLTPNAHAKTLNFSNLTIHGASNKINLENNSSVTFNKCTLNNCWLYLAWSNTTLINCTVKVDSSYDNTSALHLLSGNAGRETQLILENTTVQADSTVTEKITGVFISSTHATATAFTMKGSSKITGFTQHGVKVQQGKFVMDGGDITGNNNKSSEQDVSCEGGGVYVGEGSKYKATFEMKGGSISNNTCENTHTSPSSVRVYGGGVYVNSGSTFTMSGGTITGNELKGGTWRYGGGVQLANNVTFNMTGGNILSNTAGQYGGGISMSNNVDFTMTGGTISKNMTDNTGAGGGIFSASGCNIKIGGGTISENEAGHGGGLYLSAGTTAYLYGTAQIIDNPRGGGLYVKSAYNDKNGAIESFLYLGAKPAANGGDVVPAGTVTITGNKSNTICGVYVENVEYDHPTNSTIKVKGKVYHYSATIKGNTSVESSTYPDYRDICIKGSDYHLMTNNSKIEGSTWLTVTDYNGTSCFSRLYLHAPMENQGWGTVYLDDKYVSGTQVLTEETGGNNVSTSQLPTFQKKDGTNVTIQNGIVQ